MVISHDIEDSLLPPEILSIVDRFNAPITKEFANVAQEALSFGSFEIYQEALKSPLLSLDSDNTRWRDEIPVTNLIDTTLTFVKTLRVVSSPGHIHRFGSRPTYGTWASFIASLGFASSEDAFVISDTPFLLPRTVGSTQVQPTVFEGTASLLIAWAIWPRERTQAEIDAEDTLENPQQTKTAEEVVDVMEHSSQCGGSNSKELDEEVPMEGDEFDSEGVEDAVDEMEINREVDDSCLEETDSECSVDEEVDSGGETEEELEAEDLEYPFVQNVHVQRSQNLESSNSENSQDIYDNVEAPDDGHILPGTGRRINCLLPSLCIADKDNIQHLVTSIVYQRYAWGIFLPTIGIEIEGDGTTARVLIGWVDENNLQVVEQLPSIHLAFSSNLQNPHPSRGVYDLLDPASTLHFAQFILWTGDHLTRIGKSLDNAVPQDFCWRLDHRGFDDCSMHPHDNVASQNYRDRVETWRSTTASELPENLASLPAEVHIMTTQNSAPSQKQYGQNSAPGSTSNEMGLTASAGSDRLEAPRVGLSEKGSSASKSDSFSVSAFATLNPSDAIANARRGPELWLWERLTVRISRISFMNPESDFQRRINMMVEGYNNMLAIVFPKQWMTLDDMPKSDKFVNEFRTELHKQLVDYSTNHPEVLTDGDLEPALQSFAEHPTILYTTLRDAQRYRQQEQMRINIPEADTRRLWENLLHTFASSSSDKPQSPSFYREKNIHFPKNDFVGNPSSYPVKWQVKIQYMVAVQQLAEIIMRPISKEVRSVIQGAFDHARKATNSLQGHPLTIPPMPRKEPYIGRTDSVLAITVPVINPPATQSLATCSPRPPKRQLINFKQTILHLFNKGMHRKDQPGVILKQKVLSPWETATLDPAAPDSVTQENKVSPHITCLMCPPITEPLGKIFPCCKVNPLMLCVPFFFTEYKNDNNTILQALNRCKLSSISAVKSLAALGIYNFPIYGLVVNGLQGTLLMTWHSQESPQPNATTTCDGYNVLMDTYLVSFDLDNPLDMYHFILTIRRIYSHGLKLQDMLTKLDLEDILKDDFAK